MSTIHEINEGWQEFALQPTWAQLHKAQTEYDELRARVVALEVENVESEKDALLRQALAALRASTPKACPMDDDYAEQGWHRHSKAIEAIRNHLGVET